jgi:glycosyltransferase involved in cell wall biosynthesis
MNLLFETGPLFYTAFNVRLFFFLLFHRCELIVSNDLDTLLPNFLVSKIKRVPLVYDMHEIFTEVPELQQNSFKKRIWRSLEAWLLPRLSHVFTVNQSIARWYKEKYGIEPSVVRNIPARMKQGPSGTRAQLGLPPDGKIIVVQGAGINIHRGTEELIEAMQYVSQALLLVIGSGDVIDKLKARVLELNLEKKIRFIGKRPYAEMMEYTRHADIGLTIDKASSLNYQYSLPNKLFDYILAGAAVLASRLTEIEKVINKYDIGDFIDSHQPEHIAAKINFMLSSEGLLRKWKENTKLAARDLCWENEELELLKVYKKYL